MATAGRRVQAVPDLDAVERLTPFEGKQVVRTAVEMPGAAGGLRNALEVDPVEWQHGEPAYLVFEVKTSKVRFDPVKGAEDRLERVHVLGIENATVADERDVRALLDAQAKRIEDARGIQRLDLDGDHDEDGEEGNGEEE